MSTDRMPGVCLTYDDLFVDNWCAMRPLFRAFGARVTFCVAGLHTATPRQVDGLLALQDDGHEIALHSRTHPKLAPYLEEHGLDRWLADEVDRGVEEHRAAGFPATSFACPYHASTPETRKQLAPRFAVVRTRGPRGVTLDEAPKRVYRAPGRLNMVHNIGSADIAHANHGGWDHVTGLLDIIGDIGGTAVFSGHDIRAGRDPGFYTRPRQLERLLEAIADRGLAFRTLTGFATAGQTAA